ncbi:MAG: PDZ domain-containing protein, partial [Clostridium sp.]|nr:PDZ domain-containing protein [Clostridium sp.]
MSSRYSASCRLFIPVFSIRTARSGRSDGFVLFGYEGKPAQVAGVQAGDKILKVDGKPTKGLTVS